MILQIFLSFIIARSISKEDWGFYILAVSCITIFSVTSSYFPPALDYSLYYFLPKLLVLNKKSESKTFIRNTICLKLIFLFPIFVISIIIFSLFTNFFAINLKGYTDILIILSPLILMMGFRPLLYGIYRSFNKFNIVFYLNLIQFLIFIFTLLYFFVISIPINIRLLALIKLISFLIPFVINCIIITFWLSKIKRHDEPRESFKTFSKKVFKYGFPISFGYLIYGFWDQIQIQGIGFFGSLIDVTGYNISLTFSNNSISIMESLNVPLITTFSRLNSTGNKFKKIMSIYNLTIKYSLFLLLLLSGILLLSVDFFIVLIYGNSYLIFSIFLKLMLISTIFRFIYTPFEALILAQNKGKILAILRLFMISLYCSLFFIGLINFGVIGAIFGVLISHFIVSLTYMYLSLKILKIKLELKKIALQYLIYFVSLGITIILDLLFLSKLNSFLSNILNFSIIKFIPLFSAILFIFLFVLFSILFRIFKVADFENLESFFCRDKKTDIFMRKIINFIKKSIYRDKIIKKEK